MARISEEENRKIEETARKLVESMHPLLSFFATLVAFGIVLGIGWLISECVFMLYDMAKRVVAANILTVRDICALSLSTIVALFGFVHLARKNRLLTEQNMVLHEIHEKHGNFVNVTVDLVQNIIKAFDKMSNECDKRAKQAAAEQVSPNEATPTENDDAASHGEPCKSDGTVEA